MGAWGLLTRVRSSQASLRGQVYREALPYMLCDPQRLPYHRVIRATGWRQDTAMFHPSALPAMMPISGAPRYPKLSHEFEAVNVSGLYYAGD